MNYDKSQLTTAPRTGYPTLLYSDLQTDLSDIRADIAILGMPFGMAYTPKGYNNDQSNAPAAIRQLTDRIVRAPGHYDFDIGGPLLQGRSDIRFVDCGDVMPNLMNAREHYEKCEIAIDQILRGGGLPIILGGDHGITTPVLRGYKDHGPITLVHIDAHLDWRQEVNGVTEGLSSPIRRASEMGHVEDIVQIGLRAQGSARPEDLQAASEYGATLMVDVAHDLGCLGQDGTGHIGIQNMLGKVDLVMGSFSKAFGSNGGFVATNSRAVKEYLRFYSPSCTFSNALSPAQLATITKALDIVESAEGKELRGRLMANILGLRARIRARGMDFYGDPSAIVAVKTGDEALARMTARALPEMGLISNLVEFPAVGKGLARFRLQVMAGHTDEEITAAADRLHPAMTVAQARLDAGFDAVEQRLAG